MTTIVSQNTPQSQPIKSWNRQDTATTLQKLDGAHREGQSGRSFSKASGVPRTTLQYWRARRSSIEAAPCVVGFFESPEGVVFLERLVLAAHFVMTLMGRWGTRSSAHS
jgi:hypothetical protein